MATRQKYYITGQEAPHSGYYDFAGYTDGTSAPSPTAEEKAIYLTYKENFPPIRSTNKGAYWIAR